jgi:hypothetical protein
MGLATAVGRVAGVRQSTVKRRHMPKRRRETLTLIPLLLVEATPGASAASRVIFGSSPRDV